MFENFIIKICVISDKLPLSVKLPKILRNFQIDLIGNLWEITKTSGNF